MSRNNADRFNGPPQQPPAGAQPANIPRPQVPDSLGGFSFVVPTEFVELPSQGKFYPPGHVLHGVETVEIRYMTAKEEDILSSTALARAGKTLERLLDSIIVNRSIRPADLLIGDKNALLVAARITGYGDDYSFNLACHECYEELTHSFKLNPQPKDYSDDSFTIDEEQGVIFTTLPTSNIQVGFRPIFGQDDERLNKIEAKKEKHNIPFNRWIEVLNTIIVSADGNSDPSTIARFINALPAKDSRHLRSVYAKAVPDISLTTNVTCKHCSAEFESEVPITGEFFWPEQ